MSSYQSFTPPKELIDFYEANSGVSFDSADTTIDKFNYTVQWFPGSRTPYVTVPMEKDSIAHEFVVRNYESILRFQFVPLFSHGIQLCVAMTEPWNSSLIKDIMRAFNVELKIVAISESNYEELKSICYRLQRDNQEALELENRNSALLKPIETWPFDRSNPRKIVEHILTHAHRCGASDVHLDSFHDRLRVRFRINGKPDNQAPIPAEYAQDVLRAFKSFAKVPSDTRRPFSANGHLYIDNNPVDFRVEYQTSEGGGAMVLRILDNSKWEDPVWRKLPFQGENLKTVERILRSNDGLVLVTGPTGSGKTTTLMRCLLKIGPEERNIRTIEHPVEYQLPNVTHMGVIESDDPEVVNFGFMEGLRSHMRADPDVILVGEIRDLETAEAAINGALTGHLLLSTLHTLDAVLTVDRLLEIGVDPWRLQSSLRLIVAQRLVPCLCKHCSYSLPVNAAMRDEFIANGIEVPDSHLVADGCAECGERGSFGREAIFEVLDLSGELSKYVRPDSLEELRTAWREAGNRTLYQSALALAGKGIIDYRTARSFKSDA